MKKIYYYGKILGDPAASLAKQKVNRSKTRAKFAIHPEDCSSASHLHLQAVPLQHLPGGHAGTDQEEAVVIITTIISVTRNALD